MHSAKRKKKYGLRVSMNHPSLYEEYLSQGNLLFFLGLLCKQRTYQIEFEVQRLSTFIL